MFYKFFSNISEPKDHKKDLKKSNGNINLLIHSYIIVLKFTVMISNSLARKYCKCKDWP